MRNRGVTVLMIAVLLVMQVAGKAAPVQAAACTVTTNADSGAGSLRALIADAFDDHRGLIVSPTASPYIRGAGEDCLAMYMAMVETVREWHD